MDVRGPEEDEEGAMSVSEWRERRDAISWDAPHALDVVVLGDLGGWIAVREEGSQVSGCGSSGGADRVRVLTGSPKLTRSWLSHQPLGLRSCLLAPDSAG